MSEKKQCPLCGKEIDEGKSFCDDCQNHMDNQYTIDLLDDDELAADREPDMDEASEAGHTGSAAEASEHSNEQPAADTAKNGLSKGIVFVLVGAVLIVLTGIFSVLIIRDTRQSAENEERFWTAIVEDNTPISYAKYLVSYPDGIYAQEAENRIRELREAETKAWENLKKSDDINDFYTYIGDNPNTPHIAQIRFLMDSLSWLAAAKDNTWEAYKAYIGNAELGNITGNYSHLAQERYTYLSQIVTLEGTALDSAKTQLKHIFKVLSDNKPREMLKIFAPQAIYFDTDTTSTAIVATIGNYYKDEKVSHISYSARPGSMIVRKDNAGLLLADVVVDKEITYTDKVKVGKKTENRKKMQTDTLKLELDVNRQIRSVAISGKDK